MSPTRNIRTATLPVSMMQKTPPAARAEAMSLTIRNGPHHQRLWTSASLAQGPNLNSGAVETSVWFVGCQTLSKFSYLPMPIGSINDKLAFIPPNRFPHVSTVASDLA